MAGSGGYRGLILMAALLACGGARARGSLTVSSSGAVYREGNKIAFQLPPVPGEWRRVEVSDASLAFRDDNHDASILVNARCLSADDRTPLVALTNHLLIGATERKYLSQEA